MLLFLVAIMAQAPSDRLVFEAEQAREEGAPALLRALTSADIHVQRLALRALGRLENPAYSASLLPLLQSTDSEVRRAVYGALAQLRSGFPAVEYLKAERDPSVRAVLYEALGRAKPVAANTEALLAEGLSDRAPAARTGAARGLESLLRLNAKPVRPPQPATVAAIHRAFQLNTGEEMREVLLLAMNATGDHDSATIALALRDVSAQVRRLAVLDSRTWAADPSPLVRIEAVRVARSCERAVAAVNDVDMHVVLTAIDMLGELRCDAALIAPLTKSTKSWRLRAHATVALANVDPVQAAAAITALMGESVWQARVYAAYAARRIKATDTLGKLSRDPNPNVALAALITIEDARRGLQSDHSGLVFTAAEFLKNKPELGDCVPELVNAFNRLRATNQMTVRDPRVAILKRLGESENALSTTGLLEAALADRDPAVAALAASILSKRSGKTIEAKTRQIPAPALPGVHYVEALAGASARITMRGLGVITVDLLTGEAPATVATFARLAEAGAYKGLTFHRIVPNFVVQGGSPGADEYDGLVHDFMRDEVGLARNARGTIGISTRGRDTGDAQIYFNLVDNVRLDHDYTVFAATRAGLNVIDRIQEGDVIESVEIIRRK